MSLFESDVRIRSPEDLLGVLQDIKRALAQGKLRQIKSPAAGPFAVEDISEVADAGPWPDYMEAYFEDTETRCRYKLSVETFHGTGGAWERL